MRPWRWIFPATYLLHIAEELWADFPVWISTIGGGTPATATQFLVWNFVGLALMTIAVLLSRHSFGDWLLAILGATVAINGLGHGIASAATGSYVPGTVSGLAIWVPLGMVTLRLAWKHDRRMFWRTIAIGIAINAAVALLALAM